MEEKTLLNEEQKPFLNGNNWLFIYLGQYVSQLGERFINGDSIPGSLYFLELEVEKIQVNIFTINMVKKFSREW